METETKLPEGMEKRILVALHRYYTTDITFERAAEDADIPIYFLIQYVGDHNLPIIHTENDAKEGIRKVLQLNRHS